jgi:uncharacterized DUF497 family protein
MKRSDGRYAWDAAKAGQNLDKHGISFEDAVEVFDDPLAGTFHDWRHSNFEDRFISIGRLRNGKLVIVAYAILEDAVRIISARRATRADTRRYMDEHDVVNDEPMEDMGDIDTSHHYFVRGLPFRVKRGPEMMRIDDDLRAIYINEKEVNDALRLLVKENRIPHFPRVLRPFTDGSGG